MSCDRFISENSFNVNKNFILTFKYNIVSESDYGFSIFFGNSTLLHDSKLKSIKNKTTDDTLGLYGKTKQSQLPVFFCVGLDNKGKFALPYGKFVDGKTDLNNYNTITLRCIDNNTNFKYIKDSKIEDFYTPENKFNSVRILLDNNGTRLIFQLKRYNDNDYIDLSNYILQAYIRAIKKEIKDYTYGISACYDNGKMTVKDLSFTVI